MRTDPGVSWRPGSGRLRAAGPRRRDPPVRRGGERAVRGARRPLLRRREGRLGSVRGGRACRGQATWADSCPAAQDRPRGALRGRDCRCRARRGGRGRRQPAPVGRRGLRRAGRAGRARCAHRKAGAQRQADRGRRRTGRVGGQGDGGACPPGDRRAGQARAQRRHRRRPAGSRAGAHPARRRAAGRAPWLHDHGRRPGPPRPGTQSGLVLAGRPLAPSRGRAEPRVAARGGRRAADRRRRHLPGRARQLRRLPDVADVARLDTAAGRGAGRQRGPGHQPASGRWRAGWRCPPR